MDFAIVGTVIAMAYFLYIFYTAWKEVYVVSEPSIEETPEKGEAEG